MLNPKQRKFVKSYIKTGNASKAVVEAGYKPNSPAVQGSRLLANDNVQREISKVLDKAGLTDDQLSEHLNTAINKGINSDRVVLADALRGIEMALKLKDKFPAERKQIDTRSISYSLKGKSMEELQERYQELIGEAKEYKQIEP
jgi:hypothetical protein